MRLETNDTNLYLKAEEFKFETKNGFKDIKFIVMMEKTTGGFAHIPVGKVIDYLACRLLISFIRL